jgi:hypothetical protein
MEKKTQGMIRMTLSMQALRATPVLLSMMSIVYIGRLLGDNTLFKTTHVPEPGSGGSGGSGGKEKCPDDSGPGGSESSEEEDREKNRGLLVSLLSAFFINVVGSTMARKGVPDGFIVLNYGFILSPVIGYLLDVGIATEKGLSKSKRGGFGGAIHAMGSLASPTFFRYIITVFLDMFISNPIQDVIKLYFMDAKNSIPNNFLGYGQTVRRNFASLLQSIVGVATFQAYTNDTRFRWAYTDGDKEGRVANDVIMLTTAVAASLFMAYNVPGAESLNRRVPFAMFAIFLLSVGNSMKWNRCGKKPVNLFDASDEDIGLDEKTRAIIGTAMFGMFVFVGLVVPFSRAKQKLF